MICVLRRSTETARAYGRGATSDLHFHEVFGSTDLQTLSVLRAVDLAHVGNAHPLAEQNSRRGRWCKRTRRYGLSEIRQGHFPCTFRHPRPNSRKSSNVKAVQASRRHPRSCSIAPSIWARGPTSPKFGVSIVVRPPVTSVSPKWTELGVVNSTDLPTTVVAAPIMADHPGFRRGRPNCTNAESRKHCHTPHRNLLVDSHARS